MIRSLLAYLLVLSSVAVAQAKRPFIFEDMMSLKRVNEPIVSPDGKWVAFSAVVVNLEKNTKTPHLWVIPASGGDAKQLTSGPGEDRPRWSPDGKKLAFLSDRDGAQQVWTWDFDPATVSLPGGPAKITSLSTGADGEIWSPDGSTILFTSEVFPDCADDACNKAKTEAQAKLPKAQIWTHLFYRHWSTYNVGKRTHLFVVPAVGGVARDLTPGEHDAPPFSLGGQDMYAFSPDGKEVAFTSNIDEVPASSTNNEIFLVPTAGGTPKKISTSPGSDSTPLYSPDGKWIAWRMQKRPGYESDRFRLVIYNRQTGEIKNLTEGFDRWVGSFTWAPDSYSIFFAAEDKGESPLYELRLLGPTAITRSPAKSLLLRFANGESARERHCFSIGMSIQHRMRSTALFIPWAKAMRQSPPEMFDLTCKRIRTSTALTHLNERRTFTNLHAADRVLLVHGREQDQSSRLPSKAAKLRCKQKISGKASHPRWTARRLGRRLVVPLEP